MHAGAAVREVPQRGHPRVGIALHHLHDAGQHRRDDGRVRDPFALGGGDPLLGGELRERHDAPTDVGGAQHCGDTRDVERRDRDDRGFVLTRAPELERVEHVREQLVVAQHRGLRRCRRATREQQDRGDLGRIRELARDVVGGVDPVRRRDHRGLEPRDQLVELRVGQAEVQRRVAHARPRGTEQRRGHHRGQRIDHRDRGRATVVVVDTLCHRPRGASELGVSDAVVETTERDAVAQRIGGHLEDHGDVHRILPRLLWFSRRRGAVRRRASPSPGRGT